MLDLLNIQTKIVARLYAKLEHETFKQDNLQFYLLKCQAKDPF